MCSVKRSTVFGLLFATAALSQDLPPGLLLLTRVKRHVRQEQKRLSNISCLETISRQHREQKGRLKPLDTVRLEVMVSDGKELFASPGDRKFSEHPPISYAGSGSLGDSFFEGYLSKILLGNNVTYEYQGQEDISGTTLAKWKFRLPLMWSGQSIRLPNGAGIVSLHGSFWADPQTEDAVRLELIAGDIPPTLPLTEATWTVNFAQTAVTQGTHVLLAKSGESNADHIGFGRRRTHSRRGGFRRPGDAFRFPHPRELSRSRPHSAVGARYRAFRKLRRRPGIYRSTGRGRSLSLLCRFQDDAATPPS